MFLVNSRLGLFSAAFFRRHPFSLSYGVILPSSLTIVLSLALGFSPHLPVSVCGTGTLYLDSSFSWQPGIGDFATSFHSYSYLRLSMCGFACTSPYLLKRLTNWALCLSFCVTTSLNQYQVVLEYLPVFHRLRLSASP